MMPEPKFKPRDMVKFVLKKRAIVSTVAFDHDNQPVAVLREYEPHLQMGSLSRGPLYVVMAVDGAQFVANERELTPLQE